DLEDRSDHGIKRNQPLEAKNSLALVLEFRSLARLTLEPLFKKPASESFAEISLHGRILDQ
ncbi:MAG: hypothetical protein ACKOLA_15970, partial [Spartobacteria bacterium]